MLIELAGAGVLLIDDEDLLAVVVRAHEGVGLHAVVVGLRRVDVAVVGGHAAVAAVLPVADLALVLLKGHRLTRRRGVTDDGATTIGEVRGVAATDVHALGGRVVAAVSAPPAVFAVLADVRPVGAALPGGLLSRHTEVGVGVEGLAAHADLLAGGCAPEGWLVVLIAERARLSPATDHDRLPGDWVGCDHHTTTDWALRAEAGVVALHGAPCACRDPARIQIGAIPHLELDPLHALGRRLAATGRHVVGEGGVEFRRHRGSPSVGRRGRAAQGPRGG